MRREKLFRLTELVKHKFGPNKVPFGFVCAIFLLLLSPSKLIPIEAPAPANSFGAILSDPRLDAQHRLALAQELGITHYRPEDTVIETWKGRNYDAEVLSKKGFKLIMTLSNSGSSLPAVRPSRPPADLDKYRQTLDDIIDTYRIELMVVENEENNIISYTGNQEQYGAQLKAACEVAHKAGVKCTNGGLGPQLVAILVWDNYLDQGKKDLAESFISRAAPELLPSTKTPTGKFRFSQTAKKGRELLEEEKKAQIDFVNFHWTSDDPRAFQEAAEYLKASTGLQPVSNEISLRNSDPEAVKGIMGKIVELQIPYAVWLSLDRGLAKALQNPDGTLRANGLAFKQFIQTQPSPKL